MIIMHGVISLPDAMSYDKTFFMLILTEHDIYIVCGRVPWLYQYWPGGFMIFVVLCPGTHKGSTGSGSGY